MKDLPHNIASYSSVCMPLQWLLHTQSTCTESMKDLPHNIASYLSVWSCYSGSSTHINLHREHETCHTTQLLICVYAVTVAPHTQSTCTESMKDWFLTHNLHRDLKPHIHTYLSILILLYNVSMAAHIHAETTHLHLPYRLSIIIIQW